jgi:hypothetical protein
MTQLTITLCDRHDPSERVEGGHYVFVLNGKAVTTDLCLEHAKPLIQLHEELMATGVVETRSITGRIPCNACSDEFDTRTALREHRAKVHGTGERAWVCGRCSNSFTRKQNLTSHLRSEHGLDRDASLAEAAEAGRE